MDCMQNFDHHHHDHWHRERELNKIGEMSQEVPTVELAINTQKKLFPDYAITFEQVKTSGSVKQKNLDMQLKYTIHMFTFYDHDPWRQYKFAQIIYTETAAKSSFLGTSVFDPFFVTRPLCKTTKLSARVYANSKYCSTKIIAMSPFDRRYSITLPICRIIFG